MSHISDISRSYLGTPFCHQGRSRGQGLDCIGFLMVVMRENGWKPLSEETTGILDYQRYPDGVMLKKYLELEADRVSWQEAREGDIVLMRYAREPQHVGILLSRPDGGLSIIHASNPHGVIEHIFDNAWKSRLVGVYRVKEVV